MQSKSYGLILNKLSVLVHSSCLQIARETFKGLKNFYSQHLAECNTVTPFSSKSTPGVGNYPLHLDYVFVFVRHKSVCQESTPENLIERTDDETTANSQVMALSATTCFSRALFPCITTPRIKDGQLLYLMCKTHHQQV